MKKFSLFLCASALCLNPLVAASSKHVLPDPSQSASYLSGRMRDALILQVSREQYSSNLYLTFAAYFADLGLDGGEKFFRAAAADEAEHALIFFNHLLDRNEKFSMGQVDASALTPTSVLDAFIKLYENEMNVTRSIHNLYRIALEENDFASQQFLHDFLAIQVEEEKEAQDLMQLLSLGHDDPAFLIAFDEKLEEMSEED
jgi:ferritin